MYQTYLSSHLKLTISKHAQDPPSTLLRTQAEIKTLQYNQNSKYRMTSVPHMPQCLTLFLSIAAPRDSGLLNKKKQGKIAGLPDRIRSLLVTSIPKAAKNSFPVSVRGGMRRVLQTLS